MYEKYEPNLLRNHNVEAFGEAPRTPFLGSRQEMYDEASRSACIKSRRTGWLVLSAQEGGWARIYSRLGVDTNENTSATLVQSTDIKLG